MLALPRPGHPLGMKGAGAAGAFVALSLASTLAWPPGRPGNAQSGPALDRHLPQPVDPAERLTVVTVVRGHGSPARAGDSIRVRHRGQDARGTAMEDAADEGSIEFVLGAGEVIAGLDEGLAGIKVGETRRSRHPSCDGLRSVRLGADARIGGARLRDRAACPSWRGS